MAPYKILKQGYMMKEPPLSKRGIRKRVFRYWFVLVEDRNQVALVYFKTEDAYLARQKNEGFIRVDEAQNISVIGEHMGHKNAFLVKTPKGEYYLLPESRYDLHEWLFTLHTALENFKKRMQRSQEKRQQQQQQQQQVGATRPRANTVETRRKPSASAGHTPPSRRAPSPPSAPPPGSQKGGGAAANAEPETKQNSVRRKPVRPAPVPPSGRRRSSSNTSGGGGQRLSQEAPPTSHHLPQETPPPQYSASDRGFEGEAWMSQEGYGTDQDLFGTMESGQHVVDLNITQTEREELSLGEELSSIADMSPGGPPGEEMSPRGGRESQENRPPPPGPMHVRSASDSLLLQTASNSLPDLINEDSSISPEEEGPGGVAQSHSPNLGYRHTRHLSLMGGSFDTGNRKNEQNGRKKKPKRTNSVKQRSRSPPNQPPPPPPGMDTPPMAARDQPDGHAGEVLAQHSITNTSLEFSGVLHTITNVDQQLDELTEQFSSFKPSPANQSPSKVPGSPAKVAHQSPSKAANLASILFQHPKLGQSPAPEQGSSSPLTDKAGEGAPFREDEWLCDLPGKASHHGDVGPAPQALVLDHAHRAGEERPVKPKHRVMFKEEVEAIPNYEPRVDTGSPDSLLSASPVELPSGVAAIKMKLFGQQEQEAIRYKKEGVLCPKFTHPENITFGDDYFQGEERGEGRDPSPNANNNNSEEEPVSHDNAMAMVSRPQPTTVAQPAAVAPQPAIVAPQPATVAPQPATVAPQSAAVAPQPAAVAPQPFPPDPEEPDQNLYDNPWEQKTVNKYKVVGGRRRSLSPGFVKEKTPPPTAPKKFGSKMKFAEVSTKETPKPTATEVRNVHSLERKRSLERRHALERKNSLERKRSLDRRQQRGGRSSVSPPITPQRVVNESRSEDSLLASISNTLQATARYGSDSLLSSGGDSPDHGALATPPSATGNGRRNSGEMKISSRGELEKIRAAHRREITPILPHPSPLVHGNTNPVQHSSPQIYVAKSIAKRPGGGIGLQAELGKSPRMATSLEALQRRPDTHVSYNAQIQAHVFRSLV